MQQLTEQQAATAGQCLAPVSQVMPAPAMPTTMVAAEVQPMPVPVNAPESLQ